MTLYTPSVVLKLFHCVKEALHDLKSSSWKKKPKLETLHCLYEKTPSKKDRYEKETSI